MKLLVRFLFLVTLFFGNLAGLFAQSSGTAIGEWRVYPPNRSAISVANAGSKIYCATQTGFFYYDKEFNSLHNLSKIDGLHDNGINVIKYDSVTATLLIAYQNANIDLVRGEQIININDILRKSISGDKTINHICFANKMAYLSCSFGLVVLDLVKLEIRDTYNFQTSGGTTIKIFAAAILNDRIFIATSNGIMSASNQRGINLNDLKNWKTHTTADGIPASVAVGNITTIATFNNRVYAGANGFGVIHYDGAKWVQDFGDPARINQLNPGRKVLIVSNEYNIILLDAGGKTLYRGDTLISNVKETVQDRDGIFWSASPAYGLIRHNGIQFQRIVPNGPADVNGFKLFVDNRALMMLAGGYRGPSNFNSEAGFSEFINGTWSQVNYARFNDKSKYPKIHDLVDVTYNAVTGKYYFASYGNGLMAWNGPGNYRLFNNNNSPLVTSAIGDSSYVRISAVETDEAGNVWVVNPSVFSGQPALHKLKPDNTWQTYTLQNTSTGTFGNANIFEKLVIDNNGYKWLSLNPRNGSGVVVFDDVNNRFRLLNQSATTGNLPGNEVISMAKDNRGEIWIGTEKGVGVFSDPEFAFASSKSLTATTPVIARRPLLEGQAVKVIAVDGANRKWIGTENGVWLFNESGDKVIYNFTTANSPLPSDRITDIVVNHTTGDVFISTEGGLASFRAGATVTTEKLNCANVFPNPVRPGYAGDIAISGISNNASVKITDVTGTLVYQTKALGGTAIWNGNDLRGKKVRSGVYLVLSSNPDGDETCISKVAIIE